MGSPNRALLLLEGHPESDRRAQEHAVWLGRIWGCELVLAHSLRGSDGGVSEQEVIERRLSEVERALRAGGTAVSGTRVIRLKEPGQLACESARELGVRAIVIGPGCSQRVSAHVAAKLPCALILARASSPQSIAPVVVVSTHPDPLVQDENIRLAEALGSETIFVRPPSTLFPSTLLPLEWGEDRFTLVEAVDTLETALELARRRRLTWMLTEGACLPPLSRQAWAEDLLAACPETSLFMARSERSSALS